MFNLIRTRKPLAKVGKRGKELQAIRNEIWPTILWRAGYKCEGCSTPAIKRTLQWSHAFGRNGTGAGLGDFAHVGELAFALCPVCHRQYDGFLNAPLRLRLERLALSRLQKKWGGEIKPMWSPLENVRTLVRVYKAAGLTPDGGGRLPNPAEK